MDPLPQGKKQVKFLLVSIDYFTKWVEVEAPLTITEAKIQNFVWKNIVCRFGIMDDNSTAKTSETFARDWESRTNSHLQDIHKTMDRRK